jgi:hypothetical protein
MSQSQSERIKELFESFKDPYGDWCRGLVEHNYEAFTSIETELHTAIDEVCSELERLRGLADMSDRDAFDVAYHQTAIEGRPASMRGIAQAMWQAAKSHDRAVVEKLRGEVAALHSTLTQIRADHWVHWPQSDVDLTCKVLRDTEAKQESALQSLADEGQARGEWGVVK